MRKHTCSRCRKVEQIPTHQLVRFDADHHDLCRDCWEGFRSWFFAGERIKRLVETAETTTTDETPRAA